MSKSNTSPTRASTSSCGTLCLLTSLSTSLNTLPSRSYFLRITIARRMGDVVKEREIWVHSYRMPPDANMAIKMEVGIEDCLHIEFEYNKAKYVGILLIRGVRRGAHPAGIGIT